MLDEIYSSVRKEEYCVWYSYEYVYFEEGMERLLHNSVGLTIGKG